MKYLALFFCLFCICGICDAHNGKYTVDSHGCVTVGAKKSQSNSLFPRDRLPHAREGMKTDR